MLLRVDGILSASSKKQDKSSGDSGAAAFADEVSHALVNFRNNFITVNKFTG